MSQTNLSPFTIRIIFIALSAYWDKVILHCIFEKKIIHFVILHTVWKYIIECKLDKNFQNSLIIVWKRPSVGT